jgi:hypothetical protein
VKLDHTKIFTPINNFEILNNIFKTIYPTNYTKIIHSSKSMFATRRYASHDILSPNLATKINIEEDFIEIILDDSILSKDQILNTELISKLLHNSYFQIDSRGFKNIFIYSYKEINEYVQLEIFKFQLNLSTQEVTIEEDISHTILKSDLGEYHKVKPVEGNHTSVVLAIPDLEFKIIHDNLQNDYRFARFTPSMISFLTLGTIYGTDFDWTKYFYEAKTSDKNRHLYKAASSYILKLTELWKNKEDIRIYYSEEDFMKEFDQIELDSFGVAPSLIFKGDRVISAAQLFKKHWDEFSKVIPIDESLREFREKLFLGNSFFPTNRLPYQARVFFEEEESKIITRLKEILSKNVEKFINITKQDSFKDLEADTYNFYRTLFNETMKAFVELGRVPGSDRASGYGTLSLYTTSFLSYNMINILRERNELPINSIDVIFRLMVGKSPVELFNLQNFELFFDKLQNFKTTKALSFDNKRFNTLYDSNEKRVVFRSNYLIQSVLAAYTTDFKYTPHAETSKINAIIVLDKQVSLTTAKKYIKKFLENNFSRSELSHTMVISAENVFDKMAFKRMVIDRPHVYYYSDFIEEIKKESRTTKSRKISNSTSVTNSVNKAVILRDYHIFASSTTRGVAKYEKRIGDIDFEKTFFLPASKQFQGILNQKGTGATRGSRFLIDFIDTLKEIKCTKDYNFFAISQSELKKLKNYKIKTIWDLPTSLKEEELKTLRRLFHIYPTSSEGLSTWFEFPYVTNYFLERFLNTEEIDIDAARRAKIYLRFTSKISKYIELLPTELQKIYKHVDTQLVIMKENLNNPPTDSKILFSKLTNQFAISPKLLEPFSDTDSFLKTFQFQTVLNDINQIKLIDFIKSVKNNAPSHFGRYYVEQDAIEDIFGIYNLSQRFKKVLIHSYYLNSKKQVELEKIIDEIFQLHYKEIEIFIENHKARIQYDRDTN